MTQKQREKMKEIEFNYHSKTKIYNSANYDGVYDKDEEDFDEYVISERLTTDAVRSIPIFPCGFFPDASFLFEQINAVVCDFLNNVCKQKVLLRLYSKSGNLVKETELSKREKKKLFDEILKLFEQREEAEDGYINNGYLCINQFTKFISEGIWQYGLLSPEQSIITDITSWPQPIKNKDGSIIWKNECGILKPIIWFGIKGEEPIECWTLSEDPKMFEIMDYEEPYNVERWKSMWFNQFRQYDWNILFDNQGEGELIWMFAECGMEEPPIDGVREKCPIKLDKNDSKEIIKAKILDFFSSVIPWNNNNQ